MRSGNIYIAAFCAAVAAAVLMSAPAQADSTRVEYYIYLDSSRQTYSRQYECVAYSAAPCYCPRCGHGHGVTVITPMRRFGDRMTVSDHRYFSSSGTTVILQSSGGKFQPYVSYDRRYDQYSGVSYGPGVGVITSSSSGFGGAVGNPNLAPGRIEENDIRSRVRINEIRREAEERARSRR